MADNNKSLINQLPTRIKGYSDYIVYVDESGDHNLEQPNNSYPVFVLSFCIFHKKYYNKSVVQAVQNIKFKHFGHDMVILHEREISRRKGQFKSLSVEHFDEIMHDITDLIRQQNFIVISCAIHKEKLKKRYAKPYNPYDLGVLFGLERLYKFLEEKNQEDKRTFVIFEKRGLNEDNALKEAFGKICRNKNYNFEMILAHKQVNSAGLQFADLISRPIGNHVLRPEQSNRAFDIIKHKFYCKYGRKHTGHDYKGYGLKIFP